VAQADLKEEKKELGVLLGKAKSKPMNFAFLIGKDGPILEADPRKSTKALWGAGKKRGGGKGACGAMQFVNSRLTLVCEEDPPPALTKSFKDYLSERGHQIKFSFQGPEGTPASEDEKDEGNRPASPSKSSKKNAEPSSEQAPSQEESDDDEAVSGPDIKAVIARARRRPLNAVWLVGKEGLVLRAHPRLPAENLRREAKAAGGGPKGATGVLSVQGKVMVLSCEIAPPGPFAKMAQKSLMAQGVAMKVRIVLPDGTMQEAVGDDARARGPLTTSQLDGDVSALKSSMTANAEVLSEAQQAELAGTLDRVAQLLEEGEVVQAEALLADAGDFFEVVTGAPVALASQNAATDVQEPERFDRHLAAARSAYDGISNQLSDRQRGMFAHLMGLIDEASQSDPARAQKALQVLQNRLVTVKPPRPMPGVFLAQTYDQTPTRVDQLTDQVSPEDKARIDAWAEKYGNAENAWQLWDDEGGEYLAEALNGKSGLGALDEAQMVYLSDRVAQMWKRAGSGENISEAVSGISENPQARKALAMAFANGEARDARHYAKGGSTISDPESANAEFEMLLQAVDLDPAATLDAFDGVEGYLGRYAAGIDGDGVSRDRQKALLDVVGDGSVDPVAADKMVGALYMATTPDDLDNDDYRASMAKALALVNGGEDAEATAQRLNEIMASDAVQEMMCGEKIRPDLKMWILAQAAADPAFTADALSDGWESDIVSQLAAGPIMAQYEARGTDPKLLPTGDGEDAALRNTIGQALGLSPNNLPPENESEADREARREAGLDHDYYTANPALDAIADMAKTMGGDPARMSVVPVIVTNREIGVINTKVFRLERDKGPCFVDTSGKKYEGIDKWLSLNELPPGKMTYPEGLVLGARMVTANTPRVKDTIWEWIAWVGDGVALGVGITVGVVAVGAAIVGSGGLATPLVVAGGGAALWQTGRAGERLYDDHERGTDITDLSDPNVRGNWLEVGAGTLSMGAMGAAVRSARMVSVGTRVSTTAARGTAALQLTADAVDMTAMGDQALQLHSNWDRMSAGDRAQQLLSMAFWGGMAAGSTVAGGARVQDATSFNKMANMAETGSPFPVDTHPNMAPGEIRVAYDMDGGVVGNVRIERGAGPVNKQMLDLHSDVGRQIENAGALTTRLKELLGDNPNPRAGTAGWEAKLEIDKIANESRMLSERLRIKGATLTPEELVQIRVRQDELAAATQQQAMRLRDVQGSGFVASPLTGNDQRIKLGWPDAPGGNIWVASADGKPFLRRTKGSEQARIYYDEGKKAFVAQADRPDAGMTVVGHGENEMTFATRGDGKTAEAHAVLRSYHKGAERSSAELAAQDAVRVQGNDGDHAGHMVGHRFGLDQGMENMFPQDANFNTGAYKTMENEMASWIAAGGEVRLSITTSKYDGERPARVSVRYEVVDPKSGRPVYKRSQSFRNNDSQTYDRLPTEDINTMMDTAQTDGE